MGESFFPLHERRCCSFFSCVSAISDSRSTGASVKKKKKNTCKVSEAAAEKTLEGDLERVGRGVPLGDKWRRSSLLKEVRITEGEINNQSWKDLKSMLFFWLNCCTQTSANSVNRSASFGLSYRGNQGQAWWRSVIKISPQCSFFLFPTVVLQVTVGVYRCCYQAQSLPCTRFP